MFGSQKVIDIPLRDLLDKVAFAKKDSAKKRTVHVKEYVRHQGSTTTVVDAHDRHIEDVEDEQEAVAPESLAPGVEVEKEPIPTVEEAVEVPDVDVLDQNEAAKAVAAISGKRGEDLALWKKWKAGGQKKEDLAPILRSLQPILKPIVKAFQRNRLPPAAIELEAQVQAVNAIKTYKEDKGASLATYTYGYVFNKLIRFTDKYKNMARLPEERSQMVGKLQRAESELNETLGRPPTNEELSEKMAVNVKKVSLLKKETRKDLWSSGFEGPEGTSYDPAKVKTTRMEEILGLIRPELNDDERKLFDLVTSGMTKPRDLSAKLGWPGYKISRTKTSISKKIDKYMK